MKKSPFSWFKYPDADKILVKAKRTAYSQKCQHFETSGIGIDASEKKILTKFKKNCYFCKVEKTHKKQKIEEPPLDDDQVDSTHEDHSDATFEVQATSQPARPVTPPAESASWFSTLKSLFSPGNGNRFKI